MAVPKFQKPSFHDRCRTSPLCSCAEKTKHWVDAPPIPTPGKDNYVQIRNTKFDPTRYLFTMGNYNQNVTTLWIDPEFQGGSAKPTKPASFQKQISHLVRAFLKVITGQYPCVPGGYKPNPTIYISGPIHCRGSDQNWLFEERVLKIAQGVKKQLEATSGKLTQSITIKYGNDTVSCDNVSGEKAINVTLTNDSLPGAWKLFGTVSPR